MNMGVPTVGPPVSVSNGTGQCNFSGQRDRSSFIVPGQRDNGTSSKSLTTRRDGILTACTVPSRNIPGQKEKRIKNTILEKQRSLSRDFCRCSCPETKGQRDSRTRKLFLSRDKGTVEQGNFFCPGTKVQQEVPSRIVPSLGNPTSN